MSSLYKILFFEEENIMSEDKEILLSFLAGSLLGAGIALLFAPQSGDKTRKNIKKLSQNMKDRVNLTHFVNDI